MFTGAFMVPWTRFSVWPDTFVMPGPLTVDPLNVNASPVVDTAVPNVTVDAAAENAPSVKLVFNVAVTVLRTSAPPPFRTAPVCCVKTPPLMVHTRPAPTVIEPVFVKLGLVPNWVSVRSPVLSVIVPLFVDTDDARNMVNG